MRTTQGQVAFGHNIHAIITYSNMVKTFETRADGRAFSMRRVERTYFGVQTFTKNIL
jgi:hypothetical protein